MSEEIIFGTRIEHNGDVAHGLEYLKNHWNDPYVLGVFEDARTSGDRDGEFKVPGIDGVYVLKYIAEHHYSLHWFSR